MKTTKCPECHLPHLYSCSNCGEKFGFGWPTVVINGKEKKFKYCPECSHKFEKVKK